MPAAHGLFSEAAAHERAGERKGRAAARIASRRLLAHLRELLSLDFGFVLWDGSTVPADLPPNALAIVLADEGVVAAMLRRPNADTLLNLWVTARIDIRNGAIFDFLARSAQTAHERDPQASRQAPGARDCA